MINGLTYVSKYLLCLKGDKYLYGLPNYNNQTENQRNIQVEHLTCVDITNNLYFLMMCNALFDMLLQQQIAILDQYSISYLLLKTVCKLKPCLGY